MTIRVCCAQCRAVPTLLLEARSYVSCESRGVLVCWQHEERGRRWCGEVGRVKVWPVAEVGAQLAFDDLDLELKLPSGGAS